MPKKFDISQLERADLPVDEFGPEKFHELSHLHPSMSEEEFVALKEDIGVNGQMVPILIYRGKIVDGRHRWRALKELGEDLIKCHKIPHNFTKDAVRSVVIAMENRRHETKTQKAIKAWKQWKYSQGMTQQDAAARHGVSYKLVREVEQLYKLRGDALVEKLFEGAKYRLINGRTTDSIPAIVKDVKARLAEEVTHPLEEDGESGNAAIEREKFDLISDIVASLESKLKNESSEVIHEIAKAVYKLYDQKSEAEKRLQSGYGALKRTKK